MSELREECCKCLNNQTCPSCADYGSIICITKRKYEMPKNREDSVYATRFAVMQQQINEKDKRIKELEEEKQKYIVQLTDEQYRNLVDIIRKEAKQEFEQKVKEKLERIEDYFDRLNGPDEDIEYIRNIKKELLEDK